MKVKVVKVEFLAGGTQLESGIKKGQETRGKILGGGHGTYLTVVPHKLILVAENDEGSEVRLNVLYTLREALGLKRLHEAKRKALQDNHPQIVEIKMNDQGYWTLCPVSIKEWVDLSRLKPQVSTTLADILFAEPFTKSTKNAKSEGISKPPTQAAINALLQKWGRK